MDPGFGAAEGSSPPTAVVGLVDAATVVLVPVLGSSESLELGSSEFAP
jgi:hypothetical protein